MQLTAKQDTIPAMGDAPPGVFPAAAQSVLVAAPLYARHGYNNPVKYIDPSGHFCVDTGNGQICSEDDDSDGAWIPGKPGPTELTNLSTTKGEITGISASDVYNYYRDLWLQKSGWWWRVFGSDYDGFTIWDFLSMMAYHESGFDTSIVTILAEASVRFFYGGRVNYLKYEPTTENVLDWWARFSESTSRQILDGQMLREETEFSKAKDMAYFGVAFKNSPLSWKKGHAWDRPYNFGNRSILSVDTANKYRDNLHAMFVAKGIHGENPFYIPSGCAWSNWQSDSNHNATCPAVP